MTKWAKCLAGITLLAFTVVYGGTASAGLLDKLNAAAAKIKQSSQPNQPKTTGAVAGETDEDHPLNLEDHYHGSCEGKRSATCMDYTELMDQCMAPIRGYHSKLWIDRLDKKLKEEKLKDKERKNLEEDLAAFREAYKNKSDDPTIAGDKNSQRYLSDASEEDQVWVNTEFNQFNAKIMNKCEGADHMGVGHRTEFDTGPKISGDEAVAQLRAQKAQERANRPASCLGKVSGVRYTVMADMMEKKMQTMNLSGKERSDWEADIASLREAAQADTPGMPKAVDPSNPMRAMMRLSSPDDQVALSQETSRQSQELISKCGKSNMSPQDQKWNSKLDAMHEARRSKGLVDHSKSPSNHDAVADDTPRKVVDHSKCGPLGAGCLDGMKDLTSCQKEIGGYKWQVWASKMQEKFSTLKPKLSGDEIKAWREDIAAVKEAQENMSAKVNSPDPDDEFRWQDRLTRQEQQAANQEYIKLYNARMKYCNDYFTKMTDHN